MKYLTVQEVLDLAELACGGQQVAVRDLGLLSSAVHRPQSQMFGVEAYTDLFQKAAGLLQSLAVNHPLVDGNKRMAWMSTVVFLDINGTDMVEVDQDEAYKLVIEVAMGSLEDVDQIAGRLRALHDAM
ncbi:MULTISPECIES: type II toxin-antitoxin system death-on-curing family toxin [Streptomyces]|uniref:type II toxin-antitoxin system death-on-curing family toxin n=1 Tax=Streptomyces TaxID=1883 RepID=UPI000BEF30F9|nr:MULTISPECIES: type II toxin-antitoxin system death-on-curing family toxin [unclassified Streptomyces]NED03443.1 type II toxin-antitoxin system death-on-curing family toxin [Streptomyces sp. SID6648]MBK3544726.1 type II toxin-antitoxin system death-on-curing family toxin [Streptomyces sp. MBT60]MBK3561920.1 type II toxin-antitoxin system death-on-curing family toxin [Streptomyces sp. MBT56]MBK3602563.1 type II toxin-antitoxin system death-on-curing family toxin [Streptomyces sp. MBT54]MBK361